MQIFLNSHYPSYGDRSLYGSSYSSLEGFDTVLGFQPTFSCQGNGYLFFGEEFTETLVRTSDGGQTTTNLSAPLFGDSNTGFILSACYGNGKLVLICADNFVDGVTVNNPVALVSEDDGDTFTRYKMFDDDYFYPYGIDHFVFIDNKFIAVLDEPWQLGVLYFSSDGISWTRVVFDPSGYSNGGYKQIAFNGTTFVIHSSGPYQYTFRTQNLLSSWTRVYFGSQYVVENPPFPLFITESIGIDYDGTKFLSYSYTGKIYTSTNGSTWVEHESNLDPFNEFSNAKYDFYNQLWVAFGNNKLAKSSDGLTWESFDNSLIETNYYQLNVIAGVSGTVWAWGTNTHGKLGVNDTIPRSSPVQIAASGRWVDLSCGFSHSLLIKADNTLWGCGYNKYGSVGNETFDWEISSPVQISSETNWKRISASDFNTSFAIKTDGTLWAWGLNDFSGEPLLGLGDSVNRNSPCQVGTDVDWDQVFCGYFGTYAIKTDGTLWAWGLGNLGMGSDWSVVSYPTQLGLLTDWSLVSTCRFYTLALKTDGTIWGWGDEYYGGLGMWEEPFSWSSPTQVGNSSDWVYVSTSDYRGGSTFAIKNDGSLWAWGHNSDGQLGFLPLTNQITIPTQIGSDLNWDIVDPGYQNTIAKKTNNTLWGCGYNHYGELGLGNRTAKSSPTQMGSLGVWNKVSMGRQHVMALKGEELSISPTPTISLSNTLTPTPSISESNSPTPTPTLSISESSPLVTPTPSFTGVVHPLEAG